MKENNKKEVHNEHHLPLDKASRKKLMAKFDRESNTRTFTGVNRTITKYLLIAFTIFAVYINTLGTLPTQVHRASFIGCIIFIAFIFYPGKKGIPRDDYIPWYDFVLGIVGSSCFFYYVIFFNDIVARTGKFSQTDIIIGFVGIVILMEICRRVVGIPILCIVLLFIAYAYLGPYIGGGFGHRGFGFDRIITHLFYTTEGVIGTPLGVSSTFIFLFILFGSFLERTGIGKFFIDISNSIAGSQVGGPAKVAVIASALQGTISGSSVANTVGSGSFTIPMMKKMGYKPEFAAAVEAVASTGGQIMPPIMGAAAFLMAEMTMIPYANIVTAAILPAALYFIGVWLMIHFEAKKLGLKGMPADEIPSFKELILTKGHLLIPLFALIYFMMTGTTTSRAACYAIICAIAVSMVRKDTRMTFSTFLKALEGGAKNIIGVAVACSVAGMIVGIVTLTGVGMKLASGLIAMSGGVTIVALFFTMIASIILGMGVPTTANYVIMATITAPIVVNLGIPVLAAHMFVFYFGIVADITPPVALAAYAGSAIAKSNPLMTGVTATRLAITAFIVPYIFAMNPAMLLIDTNPLEVISIIITSLIGMYGLSAGMEGFMTTRLNTIERIVCIGAGLLLINPGWQTDIMGVALICFIIIEQIRRGKKQTTLN